MLVSPAWFSYDLAESSGWFGYSLGAKEDLHSHPALSTASKLMITTNSLPGVFHLRSCLIVCGMPQLGGAEVDSQNRRLSIEATYSYFLV